MNDTNTPGEGRIARNSSLAQNLIHTDELSASLVTASRSQDN